MDDLVRFLSDCIAEDEAAARGTESVYGDIWRWSTRMDTPAIYVVRDHNGNRVAKASRENAEHIALHDPARVLRECAARRRLIAKYTQAAEGAEDDYGSEMQMVAYGNALLEAVQSYVERPGFREEWRVS